MSFWMVTTSGDGDTYGLILDLLGLAPLEGGAVALVLQALGGDQALDLGGLGVRLLALTLGLDLAADDVLADLFDCPGVISLAKNLSCIIIRLSPPALPVSLPNRNQPTCCLVAKGSGQGRVSLSHSTQTASASTAALGRR